MKPMRYAARASKFLKLALILALIAGGARAGHTSTDQTTTERILGENKYFVYFADVCITNFGEAKTEQFKDIYQLHFNAEVSFLQSDYKGAYKRVYKSQEKEAELMADILKNSYLENSKDILDQIAPDIIRSKQARAKLYLTLAYRDRAVAVNYFTIGEASNPRLYSYKLYKYVDAINMARRAKRYGFLALYESQSNELKQKIFNHLFEMERESGGQFYGRFLVKSGDSFLGELNKTYEEYEKQGVAEPVRKEEPKDAAGIKAEPAKTKEKELTSFEKKVAKRVRFRNEKTVASNLLNAEFEKAEDVIRDYVEDFNFKIIRATFEVLAAKGKESKESAVGYDSFLLHHTDNYGRLSRHSVLESFAGTVKVEDYVEKDGQKGVLQDDGAKDKDGKGSDATKEAKAVEKKDDKKEEKKEEKKGDGGK
jgi:hypothetical protein